MGQEDDSIAANRKEVNPANCPLCGKHMVIINALRSHSIQACRAHGVFGVDPPPTNDTWAIGGFEKDMTPVKLRGIGVGSYTPLTLELYRTMIKLANLKRIEEG